MDLILANATLANLSPSFLTAGDIRVRDGVIREIGQALDREGTEWVDCSGRIVMPGNVCAHTHLYSALAHGMPPPSRAPRNFLDILQLVWWRLDRALDERSLRASVHVGALDAIRSGTTSLVDHHSSQDFIIGSLDTVADGLEAIGVRGVICFEVTDRNGGEKRDMGLRETERFLSTNRRSLVAGMVGAHASFTLEDATLQSLSQLADTFARGVHVHVAEDAADEEDSLRRSGKRAGTRLVDAGILREGSIAAHCVHVTASETDDVSGSGAWMVHNCRSNMNNSVGRAPVGSFGPRRALGTDGIDEDMFAESRTAFFRAREDSLEATAEEYVAMLAGGAEVVARHFSAGPGVLEPGAAADLVVLHYDPPTPLTEENLPWHWMFAMTAQAVESVMVGGQWVLRKGEFVTVDEEKLRAEGRDEARRLWARMDEL